MGRVQRKTQQDSVAVLFAALVSFAGIVLAESTVGAAGPAVEAQAPVVGDAFAATEDGRAGERPEGFR
jgi:hypothetical protein